MSNSYAENVKRGAALLDSERPGWRDEVDLCTLDLADNDYCILGQIFGYYDAGLSALWEVNPRLAYNSVAEWILSDDLQTAFAHGFTIDLSVRLALSYDETSEWQALQEAWMTELGALPQ